MDVRHWATWCASPAPKASWISCTRAGLTMESNAVLCHAFAVSRQAISKASTLALASSCMFAAILIRAQLLMTIRMASGVPLPTTTTPLGLTRVGVLPICRSRNKAMLASTLARPSWHT